MNEIEFDYGTRSLSLAYDPARFEVIGLDRSARALSDAEIGQAFDRPVGCPSLEDIVEEGGTVLIAVPDATRRSAAGQIVNLLIRRLIAAGIQPYEINIIFSTGIHRAVTVNEREQILTPFVAQRVKTLDHGPRDLMGIVNLGETSGGIPVDLNRAVTEFDHVITVGAVTFHYFAGFTGGRKLICPGLASSRTIAETHKLAFDTDKLERAEGVGPGQLDGNPVHEALIEAVGFAPPSFSVNTIVDDNGAASEVVCGHWNEAHLEACRLYSERHEVTIEARRKTVVASCGGSPYDINLIQAHKALEAASRACADGGTIVLFAECPDGTGRPDFLDWFEAGSSKAIAERLAESYKVNGQTAWSLREMAERFDVRIVTGLPVETVDKTGMKKISESEAADILRSSQEGFLMPHGAAFLPKKAA